MATMSTETQASTHSAVDEEQETINNVRKLLKLREDQPIAQQELMSFIENLKEINKPTVEKAIVLFEAIETKFPHKTLGEDKWYLVVVSLLMLLFTNKSDSSSFPRL
jgi:hypothetical protein